MVRPPSFKNSKLRRMGRILDQNSDAPQNFCSKNWHYWNLFTLTPDKFGAAASAKKQLPRSFARSLSKAPSLLTEVALSFRVFGFWRFRLSAFKTLFGCDIIPLQSHKISKLRRLCKISVQNWKAFSASGFYLDTPSVYIIYIETPSVYIIYLEAPSVHIIYLEAPPVFIIYI